MIKRTTDKNDNIKVTFVLPYNEGQEAVSVVGDFNNWDPAANRLIKRNNGTCSASVVLEPGARYRFRYYSADGTWFNDEAADAYEASEHGPENCILQL
ncbi:MAG: isoamylase early set domain-containing protein [Caldilineaceae bacterium]|nr:isoamylase early set domain-containing protein [Caldilineaceae bacterium]